MTTTLASALEASILEHEYRVHGGPRRESTKTTNYEEAKRMLRELSPASCGLRPLQHLRRAGRPHVAELLTGRLDVAVAVATGESKSTTERTTGRKPALRLVKARS